MILKILLAVLLALFLVFFGRFAMLGKQSQKMGPSAFGVSGGRLQPCPDKPNCVCSQAPASDSGHFIEPLTASGNLPELRDRLMRNIETAGGKIVEKSTDHIRAEFKSKLFGFVDDLELLFVPGNPLTIHVRSASRVGHSDLGANRKRVEQLRASIQK